MKNFKNFVAFYIVNIVLLILANSLMPDVYTLGNNLFTPIMAALFTGFVWNYMVWNFEPFTKSIGLTVKGQTNLVVGYLVTNFVSVWLLARFSFASGFGVSSWLYALVLAFVANMTQYFVWKSMDKKK